MKKKIIGLLYRQLTYADFRHINKVGGEESGGGGQSYIDLSTKHVSESNMIDLLGMPTGVRAQGSEWTVNVKSFNINSSDNNQDVTIYRRRPQSYCISSQKIHSRNSNRVYSWQPQHGFPELYRDHIVIYLAKTSEGEIWAGWFTITETVKKSLANTPVKDILKDTPNCGYINLSGKSCLATGSRTKPFEFLNEATSISTEEVEILQFDEDTSITLIEDSSTESPQVIERIQKYRKRNRTLCQKLKALYNGTCQITGRKYAFKKKDGTYYTEVHHLIPLGKNGSDSYKNAIVVCPMMHRMLHCADVSTIDLSQIVNDELQITINGEIYTIKWKPEHAQKVKESLESNEP